VITGALDQADDPEAVLSDVLYGYRADPAPGDRVVELLRHDLHTVGEGIRRARAVGLLRGLAHARGRGLPRALWPRGLPGQYDYTDRDLTRRCAPGIPRRKKWRGLLPASEGGARAEPCVYAPQLRRFGSRRSPSMRTSRDCR
jgi:hypothetical protein